MENVLCTIHTIRLREENRTWQNAPIVERTLKPPRKRGRWQANLTKQERGHNSQ